MHSSVSYFSKVHMFNFKDLSENHAHVNIGKIQMMLNGLWAMGNIALIYTVTRPYDTLISISYNLFFEIFQGKIW